MLLYPLPRLRFSQLEGDTVDGGCGLFVEVYFPSGHIGHYKTIDLKAFFFALQIHFPLKFPVLLSPNDQTPLFSPFLEFIS